jgi:hypothetical protein
MASGSATTEVDEISRYLKLLNKIAGRTREKVHKGTGTRKAQPLPSGLLTGSAGGLGPALEKNFSLSQAQVFIQRG